jgi:protein gp37
MGKNTGISWTDDSWNPWIGCRHVSLGCLNCYMFRRREQFGAKGSDIRRTSDKTFLQPLRTEAGKKIFVCSWSDFFLPEADDWRDAAWNVIRSCDQLIFQILTKRPERILECLPEDWGGGWPNVWFGVSVEDQRSADKRLPLLTEVECAVRFVSAEPLLGPVNLSAWLSEGFVDWLIVGGESGPRAREMKKEWAMALRHQCVSFEVPFFFKQWGGNKKIDGEWGGDVLHAVKEKAFPGGGEQ